MIEEGKERTGESANGTPVFGSTVKCRLMIAFAPSTSLSFLFFFKSSSAPSPGKRIREEEEEEEKEEEAVRRFEDAEEEEEEDEELSLATNIAHRRRRKERRRRRRGDIFFARSTSAEFWRKFRTSSARIFPQICAHIIKHTHLRTQQWQPSRLRLVAPPRALLCRL